MSVYPASQITRHRATKSEMEERAGFLFAYAWQHAPVTVRQLFYAATVAGVPGIDKTEAGYNKVQSQVLALRRAGRLDYNWIADGTRLMRRPRTHDGWQAALRDTAEVYRKSLWANSEDEVEIWLEKDALGGVIIPVTSEYDVPLMVTRGFTSETFAHNAVEAVAGSDKTLVIYSLFDFDRSGRDAQESLRKKVERFGTEYGVSVAFFPLALTDEQVKDLALPVRPPKRNTTADQRWPYDYAAELDAIPPETLREMVRTAIERHLPSHELEVLKTIEAEERRTLMNFVGRAA